MQILRNDKTALVETEEDEEFPIPERLGILKSFQTVLTYFSQAYRCD